jgi:prepilin signal peptidase PulO-like enzyme (type II secretory pathway)
MLDWIATYQWTLIGVIWMLVLGPAVGNYACSVVYRLPRGKTPFERHPYCGHCNADLKPKDLFPILSWLSTRGACRYCGGAIPSVYTAIELACGAIFISYFLHFGMGEPFLLYTAYAVFVVILAAIHWQQGWISSSIYAYAFALLAMARILAEHSFYGVVQGAFLMLLLMLLMLRFSKQRAVSPFEKPWIWWFVLMGALVPLAQWHLIAPIFVVKFFVPKAGRVVVYAAGALALPLFL